MGTADLHIHSTFSDGTATVAAILHRASLHTDLDIIAITDHNTLDGAMAARDIAADYRVEVIPGMEISTRDGHMLALFLETPVRSGLSYVETAEKVRLFGGLPFAAHPGSAFVGSISSRLLCEIAAQYPGLLAGIEVENGSVTYLRENTAAQALRWRTGLSGIGNSDAHTLTDIGSAYTAFAGQTAADLHQALVSGTAVPVPVWRRAHFWRRMVSRWALRYGAGVVEILEERAGKRSRIRWARQRPA